MRLEKIHIKGFRNYDDAEIYFQQKSLIIGSNDVGKSNLLYALRLLFDKSISERDLELLDSDYNAYTQADSIEITVKICEVEEDCLKSLFGGALKDGVVIIRYTNNKRSSYSFYWGFSEETLIEIPSRQYIKRLNMQYLDANRNLLSFMNRERTKMLQLSKEERVPEDVVSDDLLISQIQAGLNDINNKVSSLTYVSSSLASVNKELSELSIHNEGQQLKYVSGNSKADEMLDNLVLSYSTDSGPLSVGGDGRNNQIFLATWISKQKVDTTLDHVTFFAIEEPEAHLHPHQQRKLSEYVQNNLSGQVFITTHSPHIISRFNPSNIIRLYSINRNTLAACSGKKKYVEDVFENFGYRLNAISSETFFSDGVFLVEGVSEVLFYTAASKKIGVDLDRLNISVLSVEGIGFKPYVALCEALCIPWVLRTDNDIFKKPSNAPTKNYYAGLTRVMGIIDELHLRAQDAEGYWKENESLSEWDVNDDPSAENISFNTTLVDKLRKTGIFLSNKDLENDLADSALRTTLFDYYHRKDKVSLVDAMKKKKAENMFNFLLHNKESLHDIRDDNLMLPLVDLAETVSERNKCE